MSVTPATRNRSVSTAVIETVADREGVDPIDLDVPLYETIDPDALDRIVQTASGAGRRTDARLEITYYGYKLIIASDGSVQICEET